MNILEEKSRLREIFISRRSAISEKKRKEAEALVANAFFGNIPITSYDKIAGYSKIAGELDIKLLMEALIEQEYICSLPVIRRDDSPLIFREYKKGMLLHRRLKFNVFEPPSTSTTIEPTILIVPLLSFDRHGHRLGFGKGFYDCTIAKLKSNFLTVGVGFSVQEHKGLLPHNKHDQKLDCIITEKEVIVSRDSV